MNISSVLPPEQKERERERKSSLHYHHHVVIDVFEIFSSRMYHYYTHTHTLYTLSTHCGLIQLHDNLVAWKPIISIVYFRWVFSSTFAFENGASRVFLNCLFKKKNVPHPLFCRVGIDFSLWARQLQKAKKKKMMIIIII